MTALWIKLLSLPTCFRKVVFLHWYSNQIMPFETSCLKWFFNKVCCMHKCRKHFSCFWIYVIGVFEKVTVRRISKWIVDYVTYIHQVTWHNDVYPFWRIRFQIILRIIYNIYQKVQNSTTDPMVQISFYKVIKFLSARL